MTYEEFRGKLRDRYFPRALRTARETEVRETEYEDLPIDEIIRRLREDVAEVPGAAPTEEMAIAIFLRRLSPEVRRFVAGLQPTTLVSAEQIALAYATEGGRRTQTSGREGPGKRQRTGGPAESSRSRDFRSAGGPNLQSRGRLGPAGSQRQLTDGLRCFNCGGSQYVRYCQTPLKTCYVCGEKGHMQQFCGRRGATPSPFVGSVTQGSRHPSQQYQQPRQFKQPRQKFRPKQSRAGNYRGRGEGSAATGAS